MVYRRRLVDAAIADVLSALGGVLVEGPRGCGKTTTSLQHAQSRIRMDAGPGLIDVNAD